MINIRAYADKYNAAIAIAESNLETKELFDKVKLEAQQEMDRIIAERRTGGPFLAVFYQKLRSAGLIKE